MGTDPRMPNNIILSHYQVADLVNDHTRQKLSISLDLGLSIVEVHRSSSGWILPDEQVLSDAHLQTAIQPVNGRSARIF